jgi:hypothetical protein
MGTEANALATFFEGVKSIIAILAKIFFNHTPEEFDEVPPSGTWEERCKDVRLPR